MAHAHARTQASSPLAATIREKQHSAHVRSLPCSPTQIAVGMRHGVCSRVFTVKHVRRVSVGYPEEPRSARVFSWGPPICACDFAGTPNLQIIFRGIPIVHTLLGALTCGFRREKVEDTQSARGFSWGSLICTQILRGIPKLHRIFERSPDLNYIFHGGPPFCK